MKPSTRRSIEVLQKIIKIETQIEIMVFGSLLIMAILAFSGYLVYLGFRHYQLQ